MHVTLTCMYTSHVATHLKSLKVFRNLCNCSASTSLSSLPFDLVRRASHARTTSRSFPLTRELESGYVVHSLWHSWDRILILLFRAARSRCKEKENTKYQERLNRGGGGGGGGGGGDNKSIGGGGDKWRDNASLAYIPCSPIYLESFVFSLKSLHTGQVLPIVIREGYILLLYMYVCMYVYMYVCMYVCMYVRMHVYKYTVMIM